MSTNCESFPFVSKSSEMKLEVFEDKPLKIGIPKFKGKLYKQCNSYLKSIGWVEEALTRFDNRCYKAENGQMTGYLLRQTGEGGIIEYLKSGDLNAAILCADKILEAQLSGEDLVVIGEPLGFGECTFKLGFPESKPLPKTFADIKQILEQGKVATSLPNTLRYLH